MAAIFDFLFGCALEEFNYENVGVERGKGRVFALQFLNLGGRQFHFPVFECILKHLVDPIGTLLLCALFTLAPGRPVASSPDSSIASSRSLHLNYLIYINSKGKNNDILHYFNKKHPFFFLSTLMKKAMNIDIIHYQKRIDCILNFIRALKLFENIATNKCYCTSSPL